MLQIHIITFDWQSYVFYHYLPCILYQHDNSKKYIRESGKNSYSSRLLFAYIKIVNFGPSRLTKLVLIWGFLFQYSWKLSAIRCYTWFSVLMYFSIMINSTDINRFRNHTGKGNNIKKIKNPLNLSSSAKKSLKWL